MLRHVTADQLNDVMDFEHVIRTTGDGGVDDVTASLYAPSLYDGELDSPDWTLLNGYSGQQSYSGPIMHPSEFIGGGMARDILSTPGIYVALVNTDLDEESEQDPTGWAVARYVGPHSWRTAPITGARTCAYCKLLPLDADDEATPCGS